MLLDVDAWGNLDQFQGVLDEAEDGTLGDVEDFLADLAAVSGAEGNLEDVVDEFSHAAFLDDLEAAVLVGDLQAAGGKSAAEDELLGGLGDVDESPHAGQAGVEAGDVDVAVPVDLGGAQGGEI